MTLAPIELGAVPVARVPFETAPPRDHSINVVAKIHKARDRARDERLPQAHQHQGAGC